MTSVIRVDPDNPDAAAIARAAECLRRGGLVAFPTETVYGLGVSALDRAAVRRLFAAKQRPATDPLIVHVASLDAVAPLVTAIPDTARALANRFWPGPLTLVLPRSAVVPDEVTAGLPTVAVRVPSHPVALALIRSADIPIAAPSANLFSRPSPTQASHVLEDLEGRIDVVVDGGPTTIGVESTVLDLSHEKPAILRPGAVTVKMLEQALPYEFPIAGPTPTPISQLESRAGSGEAPMPSPGMLERHYAPRAPLTLYEGAIDAVRPVLIDAARIALADGKVVGVIVADEDRTAFGDLDRRLVVRSLGPQDALDVIASALYTSLRELDAAGVDVILARGFPAGEGLGVAIGDRLRRAAAGRVVRC